MIKDVINNMFNKKYSQLSRAELLELLIAEIERNEDLERQVQELKDELASKEIIAKNAGSLAEAALALSGIFEAADAACAEYKELLMHRCAEQDKDNKK